MHYNISFSVVSGVLHFHYECPYDTHILFMYSSLLLFNELLIQQCWVTCSFITQNMATVVYFKPVPHTLLPTAIITHLINYSENMVSKKCSMY